MSKRYPGGIIRKTPQTPSQTSAQGIWDMASVTQAVKENTWPIAGVPDPISKSLRFRSSASAYLNRTPASAGNRQKFTISVWYKAGKIGVDPVNANIINAGGDGSSLLISGTGAFGATYNDRLLFREAGTTLFYWPMVFRDPSAWYHIVFAMDTTQATAANRAKLYVNGVDQGAFSGTAITQNTSTSINNNTAHYINLFNSAFYHSDLYYAEYYLIDGQQLTASSFGNTNAQTGVWQPIAYTGTYGTNGFYLPFSNVTSTTTIGYDFSGNSNNWTPNNISLTSGSTYDSMNDVPTQWIPYNTTGDVGALWRGNYCVLNAINTGRTLSNGNLNYAGAASGVSLGTIAVSSGKWYWETVLTGAGGSMTGIATATTVGSLSWVGSDANSYGYYTSGQKYTSGSGAAYGASWTTNDVIGVALDMDAGTLTFYKNNTSQGTAYSGLTGSFVPAVGNNSTNDVGFVNFGQRPFVYTPPSGFKTLNTTNLPTPTIGATASTTANKYMDVSLYSGTTGSNLTVTNSGSMQPDWVWLKARNQPYGHQLYDSVRGVQLRLRSNDTTAEVTNTGGVLSFNSTGFTIGTDAFINETGTTMVGWQWRAGGTPAVTNTAGSITSTVSANTTAGFSIATFTAPSGSTAYTVGHGLGTTPAMIIVKERGAAGNDWYVWHQSYSNTAQGNQRLNTTAAVGNSSQIWNNTAPTSTVFSSISGTAVSSSTTAVAYCFAQVAGYSAFGSYVGNGVADGPFIFTGFRPRYFILKNITSAQSWSVQDTSRSPYNVSSAVLLPNSSSAELTGTDFIDIVSNGFKIRHSSSGNNNNNGDTYIYMAFAESPFKFSLAR